MLTPDELRELSRLRVLLGRRVDSVFAGDYRSAVRGRGMEFDEVRAYTPGDDVRHLDWNVTARTGEPFVKQFREERQNTVILAVDVSGSARIGTGGRDGRTDRRVQMARIAGSLAWAGIRNRDRIGLLTFSDRVESWLSPRAHKNHVWSVIRGVYEAEARSRGTSLTEALAFLSRAQRRRAVIIVISDFLDDGPWQRLLGSLARRHELHALLVHDPLDEGVRQLGLVEVEDAETGATRLLDGAMWGAYAAKARLEQLTRAGAKASAIGTQDDVWVALHGHFIRQAHSR